MTLPCLCGCPRRSHKSYCTICLTCMEYVGDDGTDGERQLHSSWPSGQPTINKAAPEPGHITTSG